MDSQRPRERARRAFDAMKPLGCSKKEVIPVLKNLLQLFDNSWELIEDDGYRALANAILEARDRPQVFLLRSLFIPKSKWNEEDDYLRLGFRMMGTRSIAATVQEGFGFRRRGRTAGPGLLIPVPSKAVLATSIVGPRPFASRGPGSALLVSQQVALLIPSLPPPLRKR
jgi:hypothetical protein